MLLHFDETLQFASPYDSECAALADRHYSRRKIGARQFMPNGRKLVIRDTAGLIVFGWLLALPEYRLDKQAGYNCTIFRNESQRRSSDVILEAEAMAFRRWGPARTFTYIDPRKIASRNPGYCFKCAGYKLVHVTRRGLHLLAKESAGAGVTVPVVNAEFCSPASSHETHS